MIHWLVKAKNGFESTFTYREGVSTLTMPVKSIPLNQMLFLKIGSKNGLRIVTYRINYLENSYSLTNFNSFVVGQYMKILIDPSY